MSRCRGAVAFVLTLIVVSAADAAVTPQTRLSSAGLGAIRVGMTRVAAERAGAVTLVPVSSGASLSGACAYARPGDAALRVQLMFVRGRIARIDLARRGIATDRGIRVGDTDSRARQAYRGRLVVRPHKYVRGGFELEVQPRDRADRNLRVILETNGRRVLYVRAGRLPEVRWVELPVNAMTAGGQR